MTCKEIRAESREILGGKIFGNPWLKAVLFVFIIGTIGGAGSSITYKIKNGNALALWMIPVGLLAIAVGIVVSGILSGCLAGYFIKLKRTGDVKLTDAIDSIKGHVGEYIVLDLLMTLKLFLWALIPIAGVFIVVVKSFAYGMAVYIKQDHPEYSASECIAESCKIMDGYKWKMFCLGLSFIGWAFLGVLCLGVGAFWVEAHIDTATIVFYDKINGRTAA